MYNQEKCLIGFATGNKKRPRQDSNLCFSLRRAALYPLSYGDNLPLSYQILYYSSSASFPISKNETNVQHFASVSRYNETHTGAYACLTLVMERAGSVSGRWNVEVAEREGAEHKGHTYPLWRPFAEVTLIRRREPLLPPIFAESEPNSRETRRLFRG